MDCKDENRQREATREAMRRYRVRQKGITEQGITLKPDVIPDNLEAMTADQLYTAIYSYPEDTWIDSPEYLELMSRLRSKTVAELEAEGYWIPCWKHAEAA